MTTMHTLHVTTRWPDGHTDEWTYDQPGDAAEAHDRLARRWSNAGYDYRRDRQALTLTRDRHDPELGDYSDVVAHVGWEER